MLSLIKFINVKVQFRINFYTIAKVIVYFLFTFFVNTM